MFSKMDLATLFAVIGLVALPPTAQAQNHNSSKKSQPMIAQTQLTESQVRAAVVNYFVGTRSMSATQWASAFAADAVVQDPIAAPPLTTPAQILAQGEGFVSAFAAIGLEATYVSVHGNEAMAHWTGRGTQKDGTRVIFEGINHFTFGPDGKIKQLRGFWDPVTIRPE